MRQVSVLRKTSDDVDDAVLLFLLLTLNIFQTFFYCFHCWLWISKCLPGLPIYQVLTKIIQTICFLTLRQCIVEMPENPRLFSTCVFSAYTQHFLISFWDILYQLRNSATLCHYEIRCILEKWKFVRIIKLALFFEKKIVPRQNPLVSWFKSVAVFNLWSVYGGWGWRWGITLIFWNLLQAF